jgi:hypothetical protein
MQVNSWLLKMQITRKVLVTAFISHNSDGWRKGCYRKSSRVSANAGRLKTTDEGTSDQHPLRTFQIIFDAQRVYRRPVPGIRETSDLDMLSQVFLLVRLDSATN